MKKFGTRIADIFQSPDHTVSPRAISLGKWHDEVLNFLNTTWPSPIPLVLRAIGFLGDQSPMQAGSVSKLNPTSLPLGPVSRDVGGVQSEEYIRRQYALSARDLVPQNSVFRSRIFGPQ